MQAKQSTSDLQIPPSGMLRPTSAKFTADKHLPVEPHYVQPPEIKSYARRSAKRGMLYSVIFVSLLCTGAAWLYFRFEVILTSLFENFG